MMEWSDDAPPPYTVKQVAKKTGLSDDAIRAAAREGRLRGFRIGREWLIYRAPVDRLLRGDPPESG
jgi:excisionase family DNA binding protein